MLKKAFGAIALTAGVLAASGAEIEIRQPGYTFEVDKGQAVIRDGSGKKMLQFGDLKVGWKNPQKGSGVSAEKVDGNTVTITYKTENDPEKLVEFEAVYTVTAKGVKAVYQMTAPADMNVGGAQLSVRPVDGAKKGELHKAGLWTRDGKGGVPYEVNDGYFRAFKNKENTLWMLVTGHHGWNDTNSQHLSFKPKNKGDKERFAETFFFILPNDVSGAAAAACYNDRPFSLEFSTRKNFNWFATGDSALVTLTIANASGAALNGEKVKVTARDFDGNIVFESEEAFTVEPLKSTGLAFNLPADERNLYFLEASAEDAFTRTSIAILPPFEFKHRAEGPFGIAAFFKLPNEKEVFRLMQRLGVYHLREYDNRVAKKYGMEAFYHKNVGVNIKPEEWVKSRDKFIQDIVKQENPAFEFGNEWNMNKTREESVRRAGIYSKLTQDLKKARDEAGLDFKIISQGFVNQYPAFVRDIYNAGGWDALDGVAWHTGRGNVTPDYTKGHWNFLGSLRGLKKMLAEFGDKPIYISEGYAKTMPNDWWYDTYRQAAENVVLSYALAYAEGVTAIHWYQLHDSVWSDQGGVNHKNGEYHYGLLNRDLSFKPSAMGYAAAAEAMDGAKFKRYYEGEGELKGVLLDAPNGALAVLYDRTDGYHLSEKGENAHTEPWVSNWKSRVKHTLKASGDSVTVIDSIGRRSEVPVKNGKVTLELTGAPVMVFGLDL